MLTVMHGAEYKASRAHITPNYVHWAQICSYKSVQQYTGWLQVLRFAKAEHYDHDLDKSLYWPVSPGISI